MGSFKGALASIPATELGAQAIKGVLKSINVIPTEVIMGCVLTAGLGQAPTKQAALLAGLPESTVCTTVNKVCASGMKSVIFASQSIALNLHRIVVAGGMESMSNAPFLLQQARMGLNLGNQELVDSVIKDGLWDAKYQVHMGECAEMTAEKYGIGREEQDNHAIQSYRRSAEATRVSSKTYSKYCIIERAI